jgi:hypothetical protein
LILYYCITGEDLFRADGIASVIAKHANTNIRDLVAVQSLLPASLRDVVMAMMEEDRNMRTRSVKEVLERLTLRKIVALGLAATEEGPESANAENTPTIPFASPSALATTVPPSEEPRLAASAERRKARLRSLLDSM